MLDANLQTTLRGHFSKLQRAVVLRANLDDSKASQSMDTLLQELAACSDKISVEKVQSPSLRAPSFQVTAADQEIGIHFAGNPLGHEFSSLILAILQAGGHPPAAKPELIEQIKGLSGEFEFEIFVSLTCHNCPDVVQALNLMAVLNPNVKVTTIDGSVFREEAEQREIMAVPTIFLNGEHCFSGRKELAEILATIDSAGAQKAASSLNEKAPFDILVVGSGPAGATAAIYSARKGLRTGIVAQRMGGQVNETADIENFTSVKRTEGSILARQFAEHISDYPIDVMVPHVITKIEKVDGLWVVTTDQGAQLRAKIVIAATGATWKKLGVPGEEELRGKGVAYCPHCDGPLFKGQNVAVIGGGNSGVEAAIDLAGICKHVTLIHRRNTMVADQCLQDKLKSLPNVTILLNAITDKLEDSNGKLSALHYHDRDTNEAGKIDIAGCFVQIGLRPNTEWLQGVVELNKYGEIVTDAHGATTAEGIFAAGDCTNAPYKQIVTALGEGATASLGAFDHFIRSESVCAD